MAQRKKIGIMGGTFDPIHNGHLYMAERAYESLALDFVLFIPSGSPYMKNQVSDKMLRYEMTNIAIQGHMHFQLSDIEIKKDGNSYSVETLEELNVLYPDSELYFLVGADTLFSIEKWWQPEKIFQNSRVSVFARLGFLQDQLLVEKKRLEEKYHCEIPLVSLERVDVSSTEIRNKVKNEDSIHDLVPASVEEFIYQHKLYKTL